MKIHKLLLLITPLVLSCLPLSLSAADFDLQLQAIQKDWAVANYQLPEKQKEAAFEKLVADSERFNQANSSRAEPKIWEAIARSGYAGAMGGIKSIFKAMPQVKQARDLLLEAEKIDSSVLNGSALTSLGSLHYMVPGWPIGFGDEDKAEQYLKKALQINPDGIDSNYFYGDFLAQQGDKAGARKYLNKALVAPPRPSRTVADAGRVKEIKARLASL